MSPASASKTKVTAIEYAKIRSERAQATFQLDPVIRISLGGVHLTLELNNWAVKGILLDTGYNLMAVGFGMAVMQDPVILGSMLYWALKKHQPDLTQEDVDKMFTYRHYSYVLDCLKKSMELFLPDMSDMEIDEALGRVEANPDPL